MEVLTLNKKNITDFAGERNLLLRNAKAGWVLFVDSDEVVSSRLQKEIDQAVGSGMYDGYYLKRKNFFLGRYVGTDRIIRLAKKNSGRWEREVHETWKVKGRVGTLNNPLIHNTADNLFDYIKKIDFYSTLHARANRKEGKTASVFKIIVYPKLKFFQTFFKSHHLVFSLLQAFHSYLSWSKLYFLRS